VQASTSTGGDGSRLVLGGVCVAITADRRGAELRTSLVRLGADVVWGSTMRAVLPEADSELINETDRLLEAAPDWFAVSTGSGLRSWLEAAHAVGRGEAVEAMLRETRTVARGAKSHGALRALGIEPLFVSAKETMDDVCSWLGDHTDNSTRLGVQVHGGEVIGTLDQLRPEIRGVYTVAPYRWVLPPDTGPAEAVVRRIVDGQVDVVAQTSAPSARNLVMVADRIGLRAELIEALRGPVCIAVVGSVTARAFEEIGVCVDVMPKRPRTADLLRVIAHWAEHRRSEAQDGGQVPTAAFELVPDAAVVRIGPKVVRLGSLEFAVLAALVRRPGVVLFPEELALQAWGHRTPDDATQVRHQISRIRRKLGEHGSMVETVRSVGYRYSRPDSRVSG
jgi:uroporphyrinogen-III synthase